MSANAQNQLTQSDEVRIAEAELDELALRCRMISLGTERPKARRLLERLSDVADELSHELNRDENLGGGVAVNLWQITRGMNGGGRA